MDLFLIFPIQVFLPCQVLGYNFSENEKNPLKYNQQVQVIHHVRGKQITLYDMFREALNI